MIEQPERAAQSGGDPETDSDELSVIPGPGADIFRVVEPPAWADARHLVAAYCLSLGMTKTEAAKAAGVDRKALWRWEKHPERGVEFLSFVRELTFHTGLALRSERLRYAKKMAQHLFDKELVEDQKRHTALDWLRYLGSLAGDEVDDAPAHPVIQFIQNIYDEHRHVRLGPDQVVDGEVRELESGSEDSE